MQVVIGVSNHHVHLNKDTFLKLFGNDIELKNVKDLVQKGQYASNLFVDIKTDKNVIEHVRVLGPIRTYTQVELSKTDCYTLGLDAPVCNSGELDEASLVTIIGPKGSVSLNCAIIANRHIHLDHETRHKLGLDNDNIVKVKLNTIKGGILDNVYLKETDDGVLELHLDTDDANSHLVKSGDIAEIIRL